MAATMEVTHNLLDGSSTSSGTVLGGFSCHYPVNIKVLPNKIHVHVIRYIRCQVNIDYHNQHKSAALIGLFHGIFSVLPSVESYWNYWKPTH